MAKIALGCDHAGYPLKKFVAEKLAGLGHEVVDEGTNGPESVDYPDFAAAVARRVASGECGKGVLVCGSGLGVAIAANKIRGVRAVTCSEPLSAEMSRRHNDANVLCMGARMIGEAMAESVLVKWLETEFEGGRHQGRVDKISAME